MSHIPKGKIVLLGDDHTGKSSLAMRMQTGEFQNDFTATIGATFGSITDKTRNISLQLWDTAGQERFNQFLPLYTRNADIVLVCMETFVDTSVTNYHHIISDHAPDVHVIYVITKSDCFEESEERKYALTRLQNYIRDSEQNPTNSFEFHTTSAKTGQGTSELLQRLYDIILETGISGQTNMSVDDSNMCCRMM